MIDDVVPVAGAAKDAGLQAQLAAAVNLRVGQDQVAWSIFGIFWPANAALLIALFVGGDLPHPFVGIVISIAGTLMSGVWWLVLRRALSHVARYEALIARLEGRLNIEAELALIGSIKTPGHSARSVMPWCSGIAAFLWLVAVAGFVYLALTADGGGPMPTY